MDSSQDLLKYVMSANESSVLQSVINDSYIVDFGIIKEVVAPGIVKVIQSVAVSTKDIKIYQCVLANSCSDSLSINIVPKAGDKVIVFFPRRHNVKMFDTKEEDVIIEKYANIRNIVSGIAVLYNQCKSDYKNVIKAEAGKLDIGLAYDKTKDKCLFTAQVDDKGAMTLKNEKVEVNVKEDGKVTVSNSAGGAVEIDGTTGKIKVYNNSGNLGNILSTFMADVAGMKTTNAVSGSPCMVSPDDIVKLNLDKTKLSNVLDVSQS